MLRRGTKDLLSPSEAIMRPLFFSNSMHFQSGSNNLKDKMWGPSAAVLPLRVISSL